MPAPAPFAPPSILDRAFWDRVARDDAFAGIRALVDADVAAAPARPTMPTASDYLAARRHNDRRRIDRHWRESRRVLTSLAVRRLIDGPDADDDRLLDWWWAFATEATWTVSAHLPDNDLPALAEPTLDLASCEMAAQMAEMTECLRPWMERVSKRLAGSVLTVIDRNVLTPFADPARSWWWHADLAHINNWAGVCGGSILAACESLAAQGHQRPAARERALGMLRTFLDLAFTPGGECDEGPLYWSYGLGFACIGWSRLGAEAIARDVPMERLRSVADYPRRAWLGADRFYAANDAGPACGANASFVPWLAQAVDQPWLAWWAAAHGNVTYWHFSQIARAAVALASPVRAPAEQRPERSARLEDQQAAIMHGARDLVATLGGGHNAERHNHNDLGHVGITVAGRELIVDLGMPEYRADFFGPKRYGYLSASSRGHNVPLIGGHEQREGAEAAARVLAWDDDSLRLDLTAAYPPESGLRRWERALRREGGGFRLEDAFGTAPATAIVHVLYAAEEPRRLGPGAYAVGPLTVRVEGSAPEAERVVVVDPREHQLRFHERPLHRIELTYRTGADGALALVTRFSLGA